MDHAESQADLVKQQNMQRILDCAERLFRHYGYTKTNVADIARELGMSPANIYRFFSSKSEIHQALAERMLDVLYFGILDIFKLNISASDRLRRYAELNYKYIVEMMISEKKVHEMVIIAMEQHWPVVQDYMDRTQNLIKSIIRQGIDGGEFPEQDDVIAARCFCASLSKLSHPVLVAQFFEDDKEPTVSQLIEFALHGLKYKSTSNAF